MRLMLAFLLTSSLVLAQDDDKTSAARARIAEMDKRVTELYSASRFAEARDLEQQAVALAEKDLPPDDPAAATSLNNLARILFEMGDARGARGPYERALAIREKALGPNDRATAITLVGLALVHQALGELDAARPLFERAVAICEAVLGRDHPNTATTLDHLAGLCFAQGDLKAARPLFERALAIREKALGGDHPLTAHSLNNLAVALKDMGDSKAARPLFERALAINEKALGPDHLLTAAALGNLAWVDVDLGSLESAKRLIERALGIYEKQKGPRSPDTADCLNALGYVLWNMGDVKGARSLFEQSLAILEETLGPDSTLTARSTNNLAAVLFMTGDLAGARKLDERALAARERTLGPDHPDTILVRNNLGLVVAAEGDPEGAKPFIERAWRANLDALRTLLPALSSRERRALMASRLRQVGQYIAGMSGDASRTYAASLAWKGVALRADVATRPLPGSASPEVRRVAEELAEARRALAKLAFSPPTPRAGEPSVAEQYEGARKRVEELERRLAELLPDFAKRAFLEVELPAVREALPEGAALLDTLENCGNMYAWVVRREGDVSYVNLGRAEDLAPLAAKFREAIEKDDEKQWKEAGGALRGKLEKALGAALAGTKTLYVSPDGVLATIPWGLLPDGDGFLIERVPIVCVSGGGAGLVMAANTPRNAGAEGLLAIGGVDYEHAEGATGKGTRPERQASALPETKQEADQVAKRFIERFPKAPLHALTGSLATVARFEKLAPSARFIHVATHGYFDTEHLAVALSGATRGFSGKLMSAELAPSERPQAASRGGWNPLLLSGIVLAGVNAGDGGGPSTGLGAGSDGLLTAEELQGLDLTGTELVVLSACETGRGELAAGEGVLGLSRALFVAGAKGFMLSLWAVPDDDTREVMEGFYDALWCGRGAGTRPARTLEDALRSTQLRMILRDRGKKAFRPSTWGAWVLLR